MPLSTRGRSGRRSVGRAFAAQPQMGHDEMRVDAARPGDADGCARRRRGGSRKRTVDCGSTALRVAGGIAASQAVGSRRSGRVLMGPGTPAGSTRAHGGKWRCVAPHIGKEAVKQVPRHGEPGPGCMPTGSLRARARACATGGRIGGG
eukprot:357272-Chlamydomonas_euryale.AAC.8